MGVTIVGLLGYLAGAGKLSGAQGESVEKAKLTGTVPVSITGVIVSTEERSLTMIAGDPDAVFTKTPKGQRLVLRLDSQTRFVESRADASAMPVQVNITAKTLKKNDFISVAATVDTEGVFTAKRVTVARRADSQETMPVGSSGQGVASGVIAVVREGGFALKTDSGETIEVFTDPATKYVIAFRDKAPEEGTVSDIVVDRKVSAMGQKASDGSIQAVQVLLSK
jgi:hypothetical protein